jgi:hypothetical protein
MSEKGIGESDKADIVRFVEHLQARNISKLRATKYVYHLIVLARTASKPLGQLKKEDMERLVGRINSIDYSEETMHDYKVALKKYFQWLRGCDEDQHEYPEEVRWIKSTTKRKRLLPEALLTMEELRKMIEVAESPRDRALMLTHYESGCRIGETLSLRIVNVCFDEHGAVLIVDGKTGARANTHYQIQGEKLVHDPNIFDDQGLVINVKGKGLIVVSGCAHSGIINTVKYAQQITGVDRVHVIIGGFHLTGNFFEPIIDSTVNVLKEIAPDFIIPAHCTGIRAIIKIANALPKAFVESSVGTTFLF